jgi:hypothetical protein
MAFYTRRDEESKASETSKETLLVPPRNNTRNPAFHFSNNTRLVWTKPVIVRSYESLKISVIRN